MLLGNSARITNTSSKNEMTEPNWEPVLKVDMSGDV